MQRPLIARLVVAAAAVTVTCVAACQLDGTGVVTHNTGADTTAPTGTDGLDSGLQGLCGRVGGPTAVHAVTADAVTRLAADCRIGGYFSTLDAKSKTHLSDCMESYLGEAFDCPGVTYAGSKDSAGVACRDMTAAHKDRGISKDDQQAFLDAFVAALNATGKLVATDVGNVVTHLNDERGVYDGNKTGDTKCTCNPATSCTAAPPPPPPPNDGGGTKDAGNDSGTVKDAGGDGGIQDAAGD